MTTWLLCTLAFSGLAALGAHLIEAALPVGWPRRAVWTGAVVLSVGVPALALLSNGAWPAGLLPQAAAVDLSVLESFSGDVVTASAPVVSETSSKVDPAAAIRAGWLLLSMLVLTGYAAVWLRFMGAVGEWRRARLCQQPVRVSLATGPAVFGVRRPTIVVPTWVLSAAPSVQRMIMLHEAEHARARDHVLLALTPLAVIAMPWNLPLWWQLHRMRLAIEVDCDTRVLRRGVAVHDYGTLLIDIASRSRYMPASLAALAEPRSLLERRILAMSTRTPHSRTRAALLLAAAALLFTTAFETFTVMTPPAAAFTTTAFMTDHTNAGDVNSGDAVALDRVLATAAVDTPLVVINGEIISADRVEARLQGVEILRFEVVKADDAMDRFGARAADGVIMITTSRADAATRRAAGVEEVRAAGAGGGTAIYREVRATGATGSGATATVERVPVTVRRVDRDTVLIHAMGDTVQFNATRVIVRSAGDTAAALQPLMIVDGIFMGPNFGPGNLDPNSIERIEVIKGPAAIKLYGSRAANGVVQITTKK